MTVAMPQEFADVTDLFILEDDTLDYHDGPLSGKAHTRTSGELFAFVCQTIIPERAWHWIFVPVPEDNGDARNTAKASPDYWFSIIEDRRSGTATCRLARLEMEDVKPPLDPR